MMLVKLAGVLALAWLVVRLWRTRPRAESVTRETAAWELLSMNPANGDGLGGPPPAQVLDFTHKARTAREET